MATLIATRGLPGCGKSTRAAAWVAEDTANRARINRDDLRTMAHAGFADQERQITVIRDAAIRELLRRGVDVVCDDTNLPTRVVRDLRRLAQVTGSGFDVWDMTDVPLEVCIERDGARDRTVGEQVIRDMHRRHLARQAHPLPLPDEVSVEPTEREPYVAPDGVPDAVMVDIDGTVALMGTRKPFDWASVYQDQPNWPVVDVVRILAQHFRIIFCSGRSNVCFPETEKWLRDFVGVPFDFLLMRTAGDNRPDAIVKAEIFDEHIRHNYRVRLVLDDRNQVVRMWRSLGLPVFQVAEGNF